MTYKILQRVTIVAKEQAEKVFEYLKENYPSYDWEFDSQTEIYGSDYGEMYYEPEVRYYSDGSGSPAYEEITEGIDEWIEDEIKDKLGIEVKSIIENEGEPDYDY